MKETKTLIPRPLNTYSPAPIVHYVDLQNLHQNSTAAGFMQAEIEDHMTMPQTNSKKQNKTKQYSNMHA